MKPDLQLLGFAESLSQARQLATALDCRCDTIQVHRFPDGESLVTLPDQVADTTVILRSLDHPNDKIVELLLAIATARRNGSQRVVLVAPYLCYMRQDKAFAPGQAVSQQIIGEQLSLWVDDLITVDPHLHRVPRLDIALPHCNTSSLSAAPLLGRYLSDRGIKALLVGPDEESRQWVQQVAHASDNDFVVAGKTRTSDRQVQITLPPGDYRGRNAILVDDVISSGRTMLEAARHLFAAGANSVSALCTHALFASGAEEAMAEAGIDPLWSSDTIAHDSNRVRLAPALAEAVHDTLARPLPVRRTAPR